MKSTAPQGKKMAYFYLAFTTSAWGSLYVVSKFVFAAIPPMTVFLIRYLIASAVIVPIFRTRRGAAERVATGATTIEKGDRKYILLVGIVGYFLSVASLTMGMKLANASNASIINSMNPIFIIFFAVIFLRERITASKIVATLFAVSGAYIVLGGAKGGGELAGLVFSIASVIMWALVSVLVRRISQKYDPIAITVYGIAIATVCILPLSALELARSGLAGMFTPARLVCLLYMGVVCTAIPQLFWNKSLSMVEAGTCSLFYPLQPLVSVLLAWAVLGEPIGWRTALGAALIIGGIAANIVGSSRRR
jgi:drug/metabolite transporter (DMT)-like permease